QAPRVCRPDLDDCTQRVEWAAEGYATVAPDRILVPLKILFDDWDARFKANERSSGVVIDQPVDHVEQRTLELPPGWAATELLTERHEVGPALSVDVGSRGDGNRVVIHRAVHEKRGAGGVDTYGADREVLQTYWETRDRVLVLRERP